MGLEVHVELGTKTKMFCGCSTELGQDANTQTCPTCLGLPGALPVVNAIGVESAIKIGLALNCEIAEWCRFARKNYFYPDMPKNFQTSQYDEPIAFNGWLEVTLDDGEVVRIEEGPEPSLVLTVTDSSATADLFNAELIPKKGAKLKGLGVAAYRLESKATAT